MYGCAVHGDGGCAIYHCEVRGIISSRIEIHPDF